MSISREVLAGASPLVTDYMSYENFACILLRECTLMRRDAQSSPPEVVHELNSQQQYTSALVDVVDSNMHCYCERWQMLCREGCC